MKALQTTRERATKHALHRVDCSLCKARAKSWLEKAADIIFFSEAFESFMAALIIVDKLQDKRRAGWFWDSNTIFDSGLSAYAILVRLYLARCADSDGVSFPAIATIANKCNISRASVVRALKELEAKGWLCRKPRIIPGTKAKATTIYTLITPSEEAASTSETADLGSHRTEGRFSQNLGSAHTEPRVGSHRTREGLPIEGHMCASEPEQQDKYTAEFESFWQEYPRKKEKNFFSFACNNCCGGYVVSLRQRGRQFDKFFSFCQIRGKHDCSS